MSNDNDPKKSPGWQKRYGPNSKIKTVGETTLVGKNDRLEAERAIAARSPLRHGIMDHVDLGPEPIKGTEAQPYLGTDAEYMARERARAAAFEKEWGVKHERKLEETDSIVASDRRVPITHRRMELPTGDEAKDKRLAKPVVVGREMTVPFGDMELTPMTDEEIQPAVEREKVRIESEDVGDLTEELEMEVERAEPAKKLTR